MYDLPCKECGAACCKWNYTIYLTQEEMDWVLQSNPDYVDKTDGIRALLFKDGQCPYLKDGRCSIYEDRFSVCRRFDCVKLYDKFLKDREKYKWAFWFFKKNEVVKKFVLVQKKSRD